MKTPGLARKMKARTTAVARVQKGTRTGFYANATKKTKGGREKRTMLADVLRTNRTWNRKMGNRNRTGARSGEINKRLGPRR